MDSGHTIDVVYLDLKKALDSVPHMRLLSNYIPLGFVIHFNAGLGHSLLDDVKGFVSKIQYLRDIPQEVLSDLSSFYCIFYIPLYIACLPDTVASNVYMLADDTKIYRPMISHEDTIILQSDLDCRQSWSAKCLLNLSLHKCKVMSITKSTACNHDTADFFYYLKTKLYDY